MERRFACLERRSNTYSWYTACFRWLAFPPCWVPAFSLPQTETCQFSGTLLAGIHLLMILSVLLAVLSINWLIVLLLEKYHLVHHSLSPFRVHSKLEPKQVALILSDQAWQSPANLMMVVRNSVFHDLLYRTWNSNQSHLSSWSFLPNPCLPASVHRHLGFNHSIEYTVSNLRYFFIGMRVKQFPYSRCVLDI